MVGPWSVKNGGDLGESVLREIERVASQPGDRPAKALKVGSVTWALDLTAREARALWC